MLDQFSNEYISSGDTEIFIRRHGFGDAVLLLHGFPETHLMWHRVAPLLVSKFNVILADVTGYGQSGCPASSNERYSKRSVARDMITMMDKIGFNKFHIVGHDQGGRLAFRMALDYPDKVKTLTVLDIAPSMQSWDYADSRFCLLFYPWSLLAQPFPFPEKIIEACPNAFIEDAISTWGTPKYSFDSEVQEAYVRAIKDPKHIHAICEQFRAAATIDRVHDREDFNSLKRILCPVTVLWSDNGPINKWYEDAGGPIALWQLWASEVRGEAIRGGHFFPEEIPEQTAERILFYLSKHQ